MSRKFWAFLMATSLVITVGAATFWLQKVNDQMSPPSASANESHSVEQPSAKTENVVFEKPAAETAPVDEPTPAPAVKSAAPKSEAASSEEGTRRILFKFARASAKSVYIVGDFNDWHRQRMEKSAKGWQITLPLKPGTYKYMLVVDDKRVRDPNCKNSADGKSLINVRPLSAK